VCYVNGFMPSAATLKVKEGTVRIGGFTDYTPARLLVGQPGTPTDFGKAGEMMLNESSLAMDNGYVQFRLTADRGVAAASRSPTATRVFLAPVANAERLAA
jgi:hypothetical protein